MVWTASKIFLWSQIVLLIIAQTVTADVITGSLELHRQSGEGKTTDATGLSTESRTETYLQRYNLSFYNMIYPFVSLRAGIRVEKQDSESETDGSEVASEATTLLPSIGLALRNPFVFAGVGFEKRQEKQESQGMSQTNIRDVKNAFLGLKPEGLPTLDMQVINQNTYDKARISQDRELNTFSLSSTYKPAESVVLNYRTLHSDLDDRVVARETKSKTQSGRASYSDRFFSGRAVLSTSFNILRNEVRTMRAGSGGISRVQLFPVLGLSSINDTPPVGILDPNPALIDGNTTASSGMNIGSLPSIGGDTRKRNMGIDLGISLDISTLFVWVDRFLPDTVAGSFVWEIYTSQDNQNWSLYQTVLPAAFDVFDNRFEISFPMVRTRYIKVVTRPLSIAVVVPPGVDMNNILIGEVQAFLDQSIPEVAGSTTSNVSKAEYGDINGRLFFLRSEAYSLFYDAYYQKRDSSQPGRSLESETLINSVVGHRRFNRIVTGNAKVSRQYSENTDGAETRYATYEASLLAVGNTLPKLSHNATATVKREASTSESDRNIISFFITNNAEIYPGISALLSGGRAVVTASTETGTSRTENTMISSGTTIVPHRTLSFSANHTWTETEQDASEATASSVTQSTSRTTLFNASYNPFRALYLHGSITKFAQTGQPSRTSRSLSGSWMFQQTGGALELRFIYSEALQADTSTRSRLVGPYARWRINPKMFLESSYTIATSESPSEKSENKSLNTSFKLYF